MENIFEKAKKHPSFKEISLYEFEKAFHCLRAKYVPYQKNQMIWLAGAPIQSIGLLLTGRVRVLKYDTNGNSIILMDMAAPNFLGEIGAFAGLTHYPVNVQAIEECDVLFLDSSKVVSMCHNSCFFHGKMVEHMIQTLSKKAVMLDQKVELLSKRTIREKILFFFEIHRGDANPFSLPFNRDEMARYLCVNRTALSNELGRMRDEGLIRYRRNQFEIL